MTDFICQYKRVADTMVTIDYCNNCCKDEPECKKHYLNRLVNEEFGWYNYPSINHIKNEDVIKI